MGGGHRMLAFAEQFRVGKTVLACGVDPLSHLTALVVVIALTSYSASRKEVRPETKQTDI